MIIRVIAYAIQDSYGTGYLLNSGAYGICFNDETVIITDNLQSEQEYYYLLKKGSLNQLSQEEKNRDINKKTKILKPFLKAIDRNKSRQRHITRINPELKYSNQIYVTRVFQLREALIFFISLSVKDTAHRTMQILFNDQTSLVFDFDNQRWKYIEYHDETGEEQLTTCPSFSSLQTSESRLAKRVRYLQHWWTSRKVDKQKKQEIQDKEQAPIKKDHKEEEEEKKKESDYQLTEEHKREIDKLQYPKVEAFSSLPPRVGSALFSKNDKLVIDVEVMNYSMKARHVLQLSCSKRDDTFNSMLQQIYRNYGLKLGTVTSISVRRKSKTGIEVYDVTVKFDSFLWDSGISNGDTILVYRNS